MKVSELASYLKTVLEEAGDIPVVVQPDKAHAHMLQCPEVVDRARYWEKAYGSEVIQRAKAVVIR